MRLTTQCQPPAVDDRFLDMAERIAAEARAFRAIIHIGDWERAANTVAYDTFAARGPVADAARDAKTSRDLLHRRTPGSPNA